ncbi:hypothetical protein RIF29_26149 [Crotalaria pallida]|uniref:Uncharacterized protein n=1 Tax=Crotalaria pallida TaxID=3830 RepID=A0AAN9EPT3_CROPI
MVVTLQNQISYLQAQLAKLPQPPPPLQQATMVATMPTTCGLSTLFHPMAQSPWIMMQQRTVDQRFQYVGGGTSASGNNAAGSTRGGDDNLHALARELMQRHGSVSATSCVADKATNASPSHSYPK